MATLEVLPTTGDALRSADEGGPLSASLVVESVASRRTGGVRKADCPCDTPNASGCAGGRHADRESDRAVLLNAFDGAVHLAEESEFWDAVHILSHAEVARLAVRSVTREQRQALREQLPAVWSRRGRGDRRQLQEELARTREAGEWLTEAHRRRLLRGD